MRHGVRYTYYITLLCLVHAILTGCLVELGERSPAPLLGLVVAGGCNYCPAARRCCYFADGVSVFDFVLLCAVRAWAWTAFLGRLLW